MKVPINLGSAPQIDTQVSYPRLRNGFVGGSAIYFLPQFEEILSLIGAQAIHFTSFNDQYVVVSKTAIYYFNGTALTLIASITQTISAIQVTENRDHQIIIVNGTFAYVFSQKTSILTTLGATQGFDITNPVDVLVLNTFTIIAGGTDKKWSVSSPNNALIWAANDIVVTDENFGELSGLGEADNNLFVFGEFSVQRWVPAIERTIYDFPFSQDPNFRQQYGAISTASIVSQDNAVYYLSNDNHVRKISNNQVKRLTTPGIALQIEVCNNTRESVGTSYFHKGTYFYHLSLSTESWVFNLDNNTWSESDLFLQDVSIQKFVSTITTSNVSTFALQQDRIGKLGLFLQTQKGNLLLQTSRINFSRSAPFPRITLRQVVAILSQGNESHPDLQIADLAVSMDNLLFGNNVRVALAKAGKRVVQARWFMNLNGTSFTFRFLFVTNFDIGIESVVSNFNNDKMMEGIS